MSKPPRRVLVVGATGHIGQAVVRHALANGREVTAATRRENPECLRNLGVKVARVDDGFKSLAELAAGHDLVVDAAAPFPLIPGVPGCGQWQAQVNEAVMRMKAVIDAARCNGARLVYVSSFTTLARGGSATDRAAALWRRSYSPYFEAKVAMERAVIAAAREGMEAVVVNPVACFGPWEFRARERCFVRLVVERGLPMILDQGVCVMDTRDAAEAIDRALAKEIYGRPIPIAGHNVGAHELSLRIARMAGIARPQIMPVHPASASAFAYWMQMACMAWGFEPPTAMNFIPLIADSCPMVRSPEQMALGVRIRPLEDTLRDSIAFHQGRMYAQESQEQDSRRV